MPPDQAALILAKLCSFGPLLYIGLMLAIDPASILRLSRMTVHALHNFKHAWRGFPLQGWLREPELADLSKMGRIGVRLTGVILAACAVLSIAVAN